LNVNLLAPGDLRLSQQQQQTIKQQQQTTGRQRTTERKRQQIKFEDAAISIETFIVTR
jgi:hypothetical protein